MPDKDFLLPECWSEVELLKMLGYNAKHIIKCNGKSDVIATQFKQRNENHLLIGLVDLDSGLAVCAANPFVLRFSLLAMITPPLLQGQRVLGLHSTLCSVNLIFLG